MKKGVEDKLAQGVIVLACIALMILVNLIPGINFFTEENVLFMAIPSLVLAFKIGGKLSKNYDEDDNYDGYFYFIGALLLSIVVVGAIILGNR